MAYVSSFYAELAPAPEVKLSSGKIRITVGEVAINLSANEAAALRDKLADALIQASIRPDPQEAEA